MPRPKPPEEIKPRCIRLSDKEWEIFRSVGGVDWLRSRLGKLRVANNLKAIRNRRIRIDHVAGMSMSLIGRKYGLDTSTISRIIK